MGRRLDENLGGVGFDNLIAGTYPPADVFRVQLKAGQGLLERGTLLYSGGVTGTIGILTAEALGNANAVLAEQADTGEEASGTVPGTAYRTGHFNTQRLAAADGHEITAAEREALRTAGILLSDAVEI